MSSSAFYWRWRIHHPQELLLYVVMSALDFIATQALLQHDGALRFHEANPVARYVLYTWGPRGMLYFKMAVTGLVCVISQIVAVHRPRLARGLLELGTVVVTIVVLYSAWLLLGARGHIELPL
jgi:hypothetical protein